MLQLEAQDYLLGQLASTNQEKSAQERPLFDLDELYVLCRLKEVNWRCEMCEDSLTLKRIPAGEERQLVVNQRNLSFDQRVPSLGYHRENVVFLHVRYNLAKLCRIASQL